MADLGRGPAITGELVDFDIPGVASRAYRKALQMAQDGIYELASTHDEIL